jgi:hypothetical protein
MREIFAIDVTGKAFPAGQEWENVRIEMGEFENYILRADTLRGISLGDESEFWAGYMRGLRRLHHGEAFGTDAEHALWHGIPADEPDLTRRARGEGYRSGFAGKNPVELFRDMNENYLSAKQLADACGMVDSRIRQLADVIPGGRLTDAGWRFPVSSVEFVKSLPGRGRPKGVKKEGGE